MRLPIDVHASHEVSFSATLTGRERRLAGRLEGFGDIVFGFAVSQCALQLPTDRGHVDIAHPVALLLYFATFALIASLWLTYHRLLSGTFAPSGVDLFVAFAYLALVSLIPYAMYGITHDVQDAANARLAFSDYAALYTTMTALSVLLSLRNLRRGYFFLSDDDRRSVWFSFLRQSVLVVMMLAAFGLDLAYGAPVAGIFLFGISPAIAVAKALFSRVPSAARLRIVPPNA